MAAGSVGLDHLILGIANLQRGMDAFTDSAGVAPQPGGQHPGRGTTNALVSLGKDCYLEILAPASATPDSSLGDLATLDVLTPWGWAIHTRDLAGLVSHLRADGFDISDPRPGSRRRPDGAVLTWTTAYVQGIDLELAPFFIQWGSTTPHPSGTSPQGCRFKNLRLIEPHPERLRHLLATLGYSVHVEDGPAPGIIITLESPKGPVSFRR